MPNLPAYSVNIMTQLRTNLSPDAFGVWCPLRGCVVFAFLLVVFSRSPVLAAADRLDPFEASFTVLERAGQWRDIQAVMDFTIHNDTTGSLVGSKFICTHEVESIQVTDGEGTRLPYTIKKYPRNRIVWEYGPPRNGQRRVRIAFVMRNSVQCDGGVCGFEIDWIGWERPVANATCTIVFPGDVPQQDIVSIAPDGFTRTAGQGTTSMTRRFDSLREKVLRISVKTPAGKPAAAPEPPRKAAAAAAAPGAVHVRDIRIGRRAPDCDRLVFDLSARVPCSVTYSPDQRRITVQWERAIVVDPEAAEKTSLSSRYISRVAWQKTAGGALAAIITPKPGPVRVRYGSLPAPPRQYVDCIRTKAAPAASVPPPPSRQEEAQEEHPQVREQNIAPPTPPPSSTTTVATSAPPPEPSVPIRQKLMYVKAAKLLDRNEYVQARETFEHFLERYPDSGLKEDVLFDIARCWYGSVSQGTLDNCPQTIEACRRAIVNFPESERAPLAALRIAECHRLQQFYIEARSQYELVIGKYPGHAVIEDARFWKAECLYRMQHFREACAEFEQFLEVYPESRHVKAATFRIADCYLKLNDFDRAEYYYEKALKRWPDMVMLPVDVLNNIGQAFYYKGRFEKSRQAFFLSFNLYPDQEYPDRALRQVGDSYQWEGRMQEALRMYGCVMDLYPDSRESLIAAMRAADLGVNVSGLESARVSYRGLNPYREPRGIYQLVLDSDTGSDLRIEAYYKLGFIQARQGRYAEAVGNFKHAMYGEEQGRYYERALENIQRIVAKMIMAAAEQDRPFTVVELWAQHEAPFFMSTGDCDLLCTVAEACARTGLFGESRALHARISSMRGADETCRQRSTVALARLMIEAGEREQARELLSLLLYAEDATLPADVTREARLALADVHFLEGEYSAAITLYSDALSAGGSDWRFARSLYRLGRAFASAGYRYNGITCLNRFLELSPRITSHDAQVAACTREARIRVGDLLLEEKNYKAAIPVFQEIAKGDAAPETIGWAKLRWGEALASIGQYEQATERFTEVAEALPGTCLGDYARSKMNEITWRRQLEPARG